MHLNGIVGRLKSSLRRKPLQRGSLAGVALAAVLHPRHLVIQQLADLVIARHRRNFLLHELVAPDLAPECLALAGVLNAGIQRRTNYTDTAGTHRITPVIKAAHRNPKALALKPDAIALRHAHPGAIYPAGAARTHAKLAMNVTDRNTRPIRLHHKSRDRIMRIITLAFCLGEPENMMRLGRE